MSDCNEEGAECREKVKKIGCSGMEDDGTRLSSLAERVWFIYTYPLLNRHFLKQEQSVNA
jgi:hypothetical protein